MLDRINLGGLIGAHVRTLRSYRTGKYRARDLVGYWGVPALAAGLVALYDASIVPVANMAVTVVSIFAGLLFSLLILIYQSSQETRPGGAGERTRRDLLEQAFANTAFAIFLAIPTVLVTVLARAVAPTPSAGRGGAAAQAASSGSVWATVTAALSVFLFGLFLITLLMILRRVGALIRSDLRTPRATAPRSEDPKRAAG